MDGVEAFGVIQAWDVDPSESWPTELIAMMKNMNSDSPAPEIIESRIDMIVAFDRRSRMKNIKVPTLVICAEDDILTPPDLSEELKNGIEGARLTQLHWGAHACSQTAPTDFMEPVQTFLSEPWVTIVPTKN